MVKKNQGKRSASRSATKKTTRNKKHFFTVQEDAEVLKFLHNNSSKMNKSEIAKTLADKMKLSSESVRERIKKYLSSLTTADKASIQKAANVN